MLPGIQVEWKNSLNNLDWICASLSAVTVEETRNVEIQWCREALKSVSLEASVIGLQNSQRVKRSEHVDGTRHPSSGNKGPMRLYVDRRIVFIIRVDWARKGLDMLTSLAWFTDVQWKFLSNKNISVQVRPNIAIGNNFNEGACTGMKHRV